MTGCCFDISIATWNADCKCHTPLHMDDKSTAEVPQRPPLYRCPNLLLMPSTISTCHLSPSPSHPHTHTHTHTHTPPHTHTQTHICTHITLSCHYMHTHTRRHECTYTHTHTHI